jgi:hypothetical protein
MADLDTSVGTIVDLTSMDSMRVRFVSGPRAGSTWACRLWSRDGHEPRGPHRWQAQSDLAWLQGEGWGVGDSVTVTEMGMDQYGRLVGDVVHDATGQHLGAILATAGRGVPTTHVLVGTTHYISSSPRLAGFGEAETLVVDGTLP